MKKKYTIAHSNENGQVAIFVALIFQVLFIFFAMIINIGLLVHHKINLQNSVDLAAYYGAMKQAQMMNAVSHVNYQINQAYKLFLFRYHVVGQAGMRSSTHWPYNADLTNNPIVSEADESLITGAPSSAFPGGIHRSSFCIGYPPVESVADNEIYCKNYVELAKDIQLPADPNLSGLPSFLGLANIISDFAKVARDQAMKGCSQQIQFNWQILSSFLLAYRLDIQNRKQLLLHLANNVSRGTEAKDIDGESIYQGAFQTFVRNLTLANKDSVVKQYNETTGQGSTSKETSFEFINGLAQGDCGSKGDDETIPGWLSEIYIMPIAKFVDAICGSNGSTVQSYQMQFLNAGTSLVPPSSTNPKFLANVNLLNSYLPEPPGNSSAERLRKSSLGFEKNPWCSAYVGIKAKATPRIPFSPFGSVTLEAKSFAKPFGGRIGPWYGTTWPSGDLQSSSTVKTAKALPRRVQPGPLPTLQMNVNNLQPVDEDLIEPNMPRYLGDEVGVRSKLTSAFLSQGVYGTSSSEPKIRFDWWLNFVDDDKLTLSDKRSSGDPLAWNISNPNKPPFMRDLEIAAVAPNQFDSAYYSIEPNFYENYGQKISRGYPGLNFLVRGDLGSRMDSSDERLKKFSVRDQIEIAIDPQKTKAKVKDKLVYTLAKFENLLTSWNISDGAENYTFEDVLRLDRFAKCGKPIDKTDREGMQAPGACIWGGRTGYSVKLVSESIFTQEQELGGEGIVGRIKNPPPR